MRPSLSLLLRWLDALAASSGIAGLPIGPIGSDVLGNALLCVGDDVLRKLGVPFLRWVDDTWCFLDSDATFDTLLFEYGSAVAGIGLAHHPEKSRILDPIEAMDEIENSAVAYTEAITDTDAKLATALELHVGAAFLASALWPIAMGRSQRTAT